MRLRKLSAVPEQGRCKIRPGPGARHRSEQFLNHRARESSLGQGCDKGLSRVGQTIRMPPADPDLGPDPGPDPGAAPPGVFATWFGVEVPQGAHLTPEMIHALQDGSFAAAKVRSALATIRPDDRVLHLGAGPGAVSAAIARNCRPAAILSFERDLRLVSHARMLHRHNGLDDRIALRHGEVVADPCAPADRDPSCAMSADRWPGDVPVTCYDRLRRSYLHNVIVMDIDGAERVFLRHANLSGVRVVLIDLHPGLYGREGLRDCRRALNRAGYERDIGLSAAEADVFRRVRA